MVDKRVAAQLLEDGDDDLLAEATQSEQSHDLEKPELAQILETYEALKQYFVGYRTKALEERKRRYFQDKLPEKMQREQLDGRRFYSRLTHNEINRVVGQQTDNPPRFFIASGGEHDEDKAKANKQTRWANNLLAALERGARGRRQANLRRRAVDIQNEIGMVAFEIYLTKSYDDIDTDPQPGETEAKTLERLESLARERKMPFGVRVVDGLNVLFDESDDDAGCVIIAEDKPWYQVKRKYKDRDLGLPGDMPGDMPGPGTAGYPSDQPSATKPLGVITVPTLRYYDEEWYAYVVNGVLVECERHGMPGIPVIPWFGLVTGSPNMEEGVEGICYGMGPAEIALNDTITLMLDTMWKNRQPKWVVETALGGRYIAKEGKPDEPTTLDLSDLEAVQQLLPGQTLKNAYENWEPWFQMPLLSVILDMWGKSAMNPVAQGESPGASPAGYTVATLSNNALTVYKDNVMNEARAWAAVVDFIRTMIRDTLKVPVPLTAALAGRRTKGQVEWLTLAPEDITNVATLCKIDPNSESSRLANRQSWMEGNERGYLPRHIVQTNAFGAEDPSEWDDDIVLDGLRERVAQLGVEGAMMDVQMMEAPPPPPGSGLVDPSGREIPSALGAPGAAPASPNAPTVGPQESAGASAAFTGAARAGENNGYVPRSERM